MLLRFLIHFVGDAHQPLHACALFTDEYPNGDQGGNTFFVNFNNSLWRLHSVWDSGIGQYAMDFPRPFNQAAEDTLYAMALNITKEFPKSFFGNKVSDLAIENWVAESHDLAVFDAYSNGTLHNSSTLSEAYINASKTLVRQQIALAGYRLAGVISSLPFEPVKTVLTPGQIVALTVSALLVGILVGAGVLFCAQRSSAANPYDPIEG